MENETTQASKPKMALCVNASTANQQIAYWESFLVDRAVCDSLEKVDPSVLQVLPYVSLFRRGDETLGEVPTDAYVLSYTRASGSGESRLLGLSSIGFGGHIDVEVEKSILITIAEEASRELKEELGYEITPKLIYRHVMEALVNRSFIYLPETSVGSVHLGIAIGINYEHEPNKIAFTPNKDEIDNLKWIKFVAVGPEELQKYEPWSKHLLQSGQAKIAQVKQDLERFKAMQEASAQAAKIEPAHPSTVRPELQHSEETIKQQLQANQGLQA